MSRLIRAVTGEPCSHVVIEAAGFIIHSNLLGVHAESEESFTPDIVFSVPIPNNYDRLLGAFAGMNGSPYDFGAMFYLGARRLFPWLPKKNLWQCTGMFLCTEWITKYLDGAEDSMITPYKLYERLTNVKDTTS